MAPPMWAIGISSMKTNARIIRSGGAAGVEYVVFVAGFTVIHLGAYILAGVITQQFSREYYAGPSAVFVPFLRDMADPAEPQAPDPK